MGSDLPRLQCNDAGRSCGGGSSDSCDSGVVGKPIEFTHLRSGRATPSVKARDQVAALIGAQSDEVVFTGGGSEASNQAIKGTCLRRPCGFLSRIIGGRSPDSVHIVTTEVEHPATLQPIEFLSRLGARVTILPVDKFGMVDPDDVKSAITPRTRLVTVMHSNNEVGTFMPIGEIGAICQPRGILFHTDCASRSARCQWT